MTTRRQQRVAEQVRHELSKLIEHEVDDPRLELISITDVTISPDLCNANVYVSSLQGEAAREAVLAGLEARAEISAPRPGRAPETARGAELVLPLGQIAGDRRSHFAADRSD